MLRTIDLFAGIGGIRLGFDRAFGGCDTVFVSEWDKWAAGTYAANFGDVPPVSGDITAIAADEIPQFDICLAGFPCQAFSMAGKRQGFNDSYKGMSRGTLFAEVVRICDYHKPAVIFCENVKGLARHDGGKTFEVIKGSFEEIGYKVFHKVLNSADFGVPQNRERIYIVCFRDDIVPDSFEFPKGDSSDAVLADILDEAPVPSKYYLSDSYMASLKAHKARHEAAGHGFGYVIRDLDGKSGTIVCGGSGREGNLIIDHREHSMEPTTRINGSINKEDVRKLTPREWARLQGFPDSYVLEQADTHLYKQLGNSVTVPVIEAVASKIRDALAEAGIS
jgi:DNA (cytosine-5)-methyltransferase 1